MMGYSGMWFWMMGMWIVFLFIAMFAYQDAVKRGRSDGLLWFLLLLIPWVNLIALVVYFIVRAEGSSKPQIHVNALSILEQRYARSEISREEFHQMKEDIRKGDQ